ncbi:disulfide bond formation protein B [Pseudomonas sp. HAR-UPW-AIA-41]|uniref:disulfide bond formation protein B n=1 Tax=Pseudomonas sp. HAR-UPW-AIA-41 TaxID=1985301 RepID=UPI000BB35337|nr:disulfide bond formation protein B [Pseudomonas sp. HAR-UPW-AIA-41]PAV48330.1 disulfide bond formation protein B [Pseudomonas sp. HAR-UPW-AIA-41]
MPLASPRNLFALAFLACVAMMGAALYLEHVLGQEPCPLCIVQRILLIAFGLVCLLAAIHNPGRGGRMGYAGVAGLFALCGAATAGRQIWLQTVPADQLPACLPSLDYMLQAFPFQEIIRVVLHGSADCAEVNWTLFGLSIPELSLLGFVVCIGLALYQGLRRS